MKHKKWLQVTSICLIFVVLFTGCNKPEQTAEAEPEENYIVGNNEMFLSEFEKQAGDITYNKEYSFASYKKIEKLEKDIKTYKLNKKDTYVDGFSEVDNTIAVLDKTIYYRFDNKEKGLSGVNTYNYETKETETVFNTKQMKDFLVSEKAVTKKQANRMGTGFNAAHTKIHNNEIFFYLIGLIDVSESRKTGYGQGAVDFLLSYNMDSKTFTLIHTYAKKTSNEVMRSSVIHNNKFYFTSVLEIKSFNLDEEDWNTYTKAQVMEYDLETQKTSVHKEGAYNPFLFRDKLAYEKLENKKQTQYINENDEVIYTDEDTSSNGKFYERDVRTSISSYQKGFYCEYNIMNNNNTLYNKIRKQNPQLPNRKAKKNETIFYNYVGMQHKDKFQPIGLCSDSISIWLKNITYSGYCIIEVTNNETEKSMVYLYHPKTDVLYELDKMNGGTAYQLIETEKELKIVRTDYKTTTTTRYDEDFEDYLETTEEYVEETLYVMDK